MVLPEFVILLLVFLGFCFLPLLVFVDFWWSILSFTYSCWSSWVSTFCLCWCLWISGGPSLVSTSPFSPFGLPGFSAIYLYGCLWMWWSSLACFPSSPTFGFPSEVLFEVGLVRLSFEGGFGYWVLPHSWVDFSDIATLRAM